jgi:hypothetical protein
MINDVALGCRVRRCSHHDTLERDNERDDEAALNMV